MDEEVQSVETTETVPSTTENAPVENESTQTEATPDQSVAPEATSEDNRDFRKAFEAKNQDYKELKAMYNELKTQNSSQPQEMTQPQTPDEALQVLRNIVNEAVTPLLEDKIWSDFEKQPLVAQMKPEIFAELQKLPANMPLQDKLQTAREKAIINNLDTIMRVSKNSGVEQAYNNQAIKKGNAGLGQSRSQAGDVRESVVDKALRGENISTEDYKNNRAEILKAQREQFFGSSE